MGESKRMAECHPDRPHYIGGLCRQCYEHKRYEENHKHELERGRIYREENRELINAKRRERYRDNIKQEREWQCMWKEKNPEYGYEWSLENKYGITIEEYDNLLKAQHNRCMLCGKTPEQNGRRLSVDHNHETGKVRGLLCRDCNSMLGFAHDSITTLAHAISYLEENGGPPPPQYKEEDR